MGMFEKHEGRLDPGPLPWGASGMTRDCRPGEACPGKHQAGGRGPILLAFALAASACAAPGVPGDGLATPFAPTADAERGREVFVSRDGGHCVLCHAVPGVDIAGNVGPPLDGVGSRLVPAQIRLRVADITRVNPDATMPTFHRVDGLHRVAPEYRGRPALSGQQVEDVVAWLATLK